MANEFELSPKELKRQADALLAAADAAEKAAEREPAAKSAKKSTRKKGEETAQEAPAVMTDEEARKAGILRLDDKQVAALPAASWLMNNEKLRELLARGTMPCWRTCRMTSPPQRRSPMWRKRSWWIPTLW